MKNIKLLKKYAQNLVIVFTKDEIESHKLRKGDSVDISDIVFLKEGKNGKRRN